MDRTWGFEMNDIVGHRLSLLFLTRSWAGRDFAFKTQLQGNEKKNWCDVTIKILAIVTYHCIFGISLQHAAIFLTNNRSTPSNQDNICLMAYNNIWLVLFFPWILCQNHSDLSVINYHLISISLSYREIWLHQPTYLCHE